MASPLTPDQVHELKAEGLIGCIVTVDGREYHADDLHRCSEFESCGFQATDPHDLDDAGLCPHCALEARREARHLTELRSMFGRR